MSLSHLQSLRLAAVLEECADQLDILGHVMSVKAERQRGSAPGAEQERARLTKLIENCQNITQQVSNFHLEMEEKQSFSSIRKVVEEEEERKREENIRREAMREMKQRQRRLEKQRDELQQKAKELKDLEEVLQNLIYDKSEQSSIIEQKKKFLERNIELQLLLSKSETEEAEKLLEEKQELLKINLVEEVKNHEKTKTILHNRLEIVEEISKALSVNSLKAFIPMELQELQVQWRQRTQQMLQETEKKFNDVCCKRTVNMDKLTEMKRKYRELEKMVMEDRKEQEKLRQQQAEIKAAIKLQAWWRGCMVRKGFGSFKKAEDSKKGKKKKEGKKKKK